MSCDCEYPTLYRSSIVKTRKQHKCVECGEKIVIGEQVQKVDALYDGTFQTYYTCPQCYEIIEFIRNYNGENELLKELQEALCCHGELYDLLCEFVVDSQEEAEGFTCPYQPNVSWLNPFVKGKMSLKIEVMS